MVAARAQRSHQTGARVAFAELAGGVRGCSRYRTKGELSKRQAVDWLDQLRALEREIEREWWWKVEEVAVS
jgi:hypothetical protein